MTSIERIELGTPLRLQQVTLLPIEETSIRHDVSVFGHWLSVSKRLFALVVQTPFDIQAFDTEMRQIEISELKRMVPAIAAYLDR